MSLPIEAILPELNRALCNGRNAVLTAPPGAGKTTVVPLALLDAPWQGGRKIVMLEPRRVAARAAARRMAAMIGEPVGETVGYRMRLATQVMAKTRIEVVTEAILTRLLQADPELTDYGAVLFDEFHERTIQGDLGLALSLECQRLFRPDLRLLVMSATLDSPAIAELLGNASGPAPLVRCEGRQFSTEIRYLTQALTGFRGSLDELLKTVVQTIRRTLREETGSVLVFLPGMREIRRVERDLRQLGLPADVLLTPLHGELPNDQQDRAILPAPPGSRKVVLSSAIAETSLTIDGIRVVIDAGLMRIARFDPRTALTRLETVRVTQDSAEQRRGRAGRLEPGVCYRLWTVKEQQALAPRRVPEVLETDLAPIILDLAAWGSTDLYELSWLDRPPAGAVSQAHMLLRALGALDPHGQLTAHGRQMAQVPLHPRLSHMVLAAAGLGFASLACDIAALLSERDVLRFEGSRRHTDLRVRLDALYGQTADLQGAWLDASGIGRIRELSRLIHHSVTAVTGSQQPARASRHDNDAVGLVVALGYPDRIAQRQPGPERRYRLANGRGALFPEPETIASEPYVVIADLDGGEEWAHIILAAPISRETIHKCCRDQLADVQLVTWDASERAVQARTQQRLGALVLQDAAIAKADPEQVRTALIDGLRQIGSEALPWTKELRQWQARLAWMRRVERGNTKNPAGSAWPDVSDPTLLERLPDWLGPFLDGITRLDQLQRLDLSPALHSFLTWEQQRELDRLAPTHWTVPSGSRVRLDYASGDHPILSVRLQELFGCGETPRIADGRIAITLHLLSPAGRPVQVTQDLSSFWASAYQEVRKELRGRYPKHHWPEHPLAARPTARPRSLIRKPR